ncbi:hypothetical protein IFR05_008324 [Cadophora sp. M221]|nr:hypothetical protein IFR05_008324 [Cadophora sp. M221]
MASAAAKAAAISATLAAAPSTSDEPPPPYDTSSLPPNPGFCELAFRERLDNRIPGGGMPSAQYFEPCKACSFVCGDEIPPVYKQGWLDWIDPSVNFRWESHVATNKGEKDIPAEGERELLGCWICWEYEQKWVEPMESKDWYKHMRRHFFVEGYRICKGKMGAMQRRRNCDVGHCPKIHS